MTVVSASESHTKMCRFLATKLSSVAHDLLRATEVLEKELWEEEQQADLERGVVILG